MNFIPNESDHTLNYYCTWNTQNNGRLNEAEEKDFTTFEGDQGARSARDFLNDDVVFSVNGMIDQYDRIRGDLYFVFDDGWDVPYNTNPDEERYRFGSVELNEERFPSCSGHPAERLKKLNAKVMSFGWRGAGLWIAAQAEGEGKDGFRLNAEALEEYWRERARWSNLAGIQYWKVDWGERQTSIDFREMLSRVAREEAPHLTVEHCRTYGPINDGESGRFFSTGTCLEDALKIIVYSDVLRAYDVTNSLSSATTIDRVAGILNRARIDPQAQGIINCEDELYIGAALGCSIGIMRSRMCLDSPGRNYDIKNTRRAIDEAVRAVRWQRIAPAFGADKQEVYLSDDILIDSWIFSRGETWASWLIGNEIVQASPAIVTRGIEQPRVVSKDESPFIVAARNPNGAVSIAALPRTITRKGIHTPLADVELKVGSGEYPIGIFGEFRSITLIFDEPLQAKTVWGQDLAGDVAEDITNLVMIDGNRLLISYEIIRMVGLGAATAGDVSEPGMLLRVL